MTQVNSKKSEQKPQVRPRIDKKLIEEAREILVIRQAMSLTAPDENDYLHDAIKEKNEREKAAIGL